MLEEYSAYRPHVNIKVIREFHFETTRCRPLPPCLHCLNRL